MRMSPTGFCPLHDKSDAQDMYETFGVSKKTFKRGVGDLLKQHLITLPESGGIQLVDSQLAED